LPHHLIGTRRPPGKHAGDHEDQGIAAIRRHRQKLAPEQGEMKETRSGAEQERDNHHLP
jgi:hypothetical protein